MEKIFGINAKMNFRTNSELYVKPVTTTFSMYFDTRIPTAQRIYDTAFKLYYLDKKVLQNPNNHYTNRCAVLKIN